MKLTSRVIVRVMITVTIMELALLLYCAVHQSNCNIEYDLGGFEKEGPPHPSLISNAQRRLLTPSAGIFILQRTFTTAEPALHVQYIRGEQISRK